MFSVTFDDSSLAKKVIPANAESVARVMSSAFEIDGVVSMLKALMKPALELQKEYQQFLAPVIPKTRERHHIAPG